ncbi:MAG: hypothetical protein OXN17_00540 [Candidatus Poribacteria bacterium]|nr:hypothetical protein [Candidatus Poribacteria bacterium]MDE0504699.1 hypothetical protein [Candidatus Poribacteria bacterium]
MKDTWWSLVSYLLYLALGCAVVFVVTRSALSSSAKTVLIPMFFSVCVLLVALELYHKNDKLMRCLYDDMNRQLDEIRVDIKELDRG